jgi:hypothetical protein
MDIDVLLPTMKPIATIEPTVNTIFDVPTPRVPTSILLRDLQSIEELNSLLKSSSTIEAKTFKFVALLPMLTQEAVTMYISLNKKMYPVLQEIIVMI